MPGYAPGGPSGPNAPGANPGLSNPGPPGTGGGTGGGNSPPRLRLAARCLCRNPPNPGPGGPNRDSPGNGGLPSNPRMSNDFSNLPTPYISISNHLVPNKPEEDNDEQDQQK